MLAGVGDEHEPTIDITPPRPAPGDRERPLIAFMAGCSGDDAGDGDDDRARRTTPRAARRPT